MVVSAACTCGATQAVLALLGTEENDVVNWGRMRMLANYKMVKRLTEIKAKDVPAKVRRMARPLERSGGTCLSHPPLLPS